MKSYPQTFSKICSLENTWRGLDRRYSNRSNSFDEYGHYPVEFVIRVSKSAI